MGTKNTACGLPIEIKVAVFEIISEKGTNNKSSNLNLELSNGISFGKKCAGPISTATILPLKHALTIPEIVSMKTFCFFNSDNKTEATHLVPFPHALASLPSAFKICR